MKLYVSPPSPRAFKVLAVLNLLGLEAELRHVDLIAGEQMKPEFLALNPNHRMPVLDDDGFVLWESNAIMQYLAARKPSAGLWPSDTKAQADVSRWQCWELAHWGRACGTLLFERFVKKLVDGGDPDPSEVERGEREVRELAQVLDGQLRGRTWLVGEHLTLADVSVGAWLTCAELGGFPLEGRREIARWYEGLNALQSWQQTMATPPAVSAA